MFDFEFSKKITLRDKNFNITSKYFILGVYRDPYNNLMVNLIETGRNSVAFIKDTKPTNNTNVVAVQLDDLYYITNENFTEVDADFFREMQEKNERNLHFLNERASGFLDEKLNQTKQSIIDRDAVVRYGFDKVSDSIDAISSSLMSSRIITIDNDALPKSTLTSIKPGPIIDNRLSSTVHAINVTGTTLPKEEVSEEVKLLSKIKSKLTINLSKVFKAINNGIVVVYYNNTKKYFKDVTLGFDGRNYYLTSPEMLKFFRIDRVPLYDYKFTWFLMEDLEKASEGISDKETQQVNYVERLEKLKDKSE